MLPNNKLFTGSWLLVLGYLLVGCERVPEGFIPEPNQPKNTFSYAYGTVFANAGCLATGCHGGATTPLVLNTKTTAYNNLLNQTATCGGKKYVVANSTGSSYLIDKLTGNVCGGDRMPRNNPGYFDSNPTELQAIKDWINAGAPDS